MDACIVENNIIVNVVVLPDGADPAAFGCKPLPYGKWIGDEYDSDVTLSARLSAMEQSQESSAVWDELDAAYQEGVSSAYDQ